MKQDKQNTSEEWERFKTYARIYAKKAWWKFKKKARKVAFFLGVQLISMSGVSAQVVISEMQGPKDYLAKAATVKANPNYREFIEAHAREIEERENAFAKDLWQVMTKNIKKVQRGGLREITAPHEDKKIIANSRYYCASAAISSIYETTGDKYTEYNFLLECLSNPNYCPQIIKDLNKNYGERAKTNDVKRTLKEIFQKNPRSVCMVISDSKTNTSSGQHLRIVFPENVEENEENLTQQDSSFVVLDTTVVVKDDKVKGKVAGFNQNVISDVETCYKGSENKGYVYNLTDMAESDLIIEMYEKSFKEKKKSETNRFGNGRVAQLNKSKQKQEPLWVAVSNSPRPKKNTKAKVVSKVYSANQKRRSEKTV